MLSVFKQFVAFCAGAKKSKRRFYKSLIVLGWLRNFSNLPHMLLICQVMFKNYLFSVFYCQKVQVQCRRRAIVNN